MDTKEQISDQIKPAPEPTNRSRQIFQNFTNATVALLESPDTSEDVLDAVQDMLDKFNCELGGADEPASVNARWVMSNVFNLPSDAHGHGDDDDETATAARELANVFATIEEYRDYLPTPIYDGMSELMTNCVGDAQWQSKPDLMRKVLPDILREAINEQF